MTANSQSNHYDNLLCFAFIPMGGGEWNEEGTGVYKVFHPAHSRIHLLVGRLMSQQHASVSQGQICSDNSMCCHTEIEAADQTFYLTLSQYTDTRPTSPSADSLVQAPGRVATGVQICKSLVWLDPKKSCRKQDSNPGSSTPEADALTTRPARPPSRNQQWWVSVYKTLGINKVHVKRHMVQELECLVFPPCIYHRCCSTGSSPSWGLSFQALACGIFCSLTFEGFLQVLQFTLSPPPPPPPHPFPLHQIIVSVSENKCNFNSVKNNSWAPHSIGYVSHDNRSMSCTRFPHNWALARSASLSETVCGAVRNCNQKKILICDFLCHFHYHRYHQYFQHYHHYHFFLPSPNLLITFSQSSYHHHHHYYHYHHHHLHWHHHHHTNHHHHHNHYYSSTTTPTITEHARTNTA